MFTTYIIFFAIALVIGGLFCIGLWYSSLGEDSVKPDNSVTNDWAMIFYPIYRFLNRKKEETIYYSGEQLHTLIEKLQCDYKQYGDMVNEITIKEKGFVVTVKDNMEIWEGLFCDLYKKYNETQYVVNENLDGFEFYKIIEVPVINPYIAKPLLLCFKCYASIWGSIIYWSMVAFAIRTNYIQKDFAILIPMWIFYCLSLVTVNTFIEKKTR